MSKIFDSCRLWYWLIIHYIIGMTYGYIRVSTDKQTVENQRFEILGFCEKQGLAVDAWIEETISGTVDVGRRELGRLLKKVENGDLIICSELSRLGRSLFMIMSILNLLMEKGALALRRKDGVALGRPKGSRCEGSVLDGAELAVSVMLLAGTSMSQMTRALGTHHRTLSRFIERRHLDSGENLARVREMLGQEIFLDFLT